MSVTRRLHTCSKHHRLRTPPGRQLHVSYMSVTCQLHVNYTPAVSVAGAEPCIHFRQLLAAGERDFQVVEARVGDFEGEMHARRHARLLRLD